MSTLRHDRTLRGAAGITECVQIETLLRLKELALPGQRRVLLRIGSVRSDLGLRGQAPASPAFDACIHPCVTAKCTICARECKFILSVARAL
jgi:hypothetical protein